MPSRAESLVRITEPLRHLRGRAFWRSLEELADTARFRDALEREFPDGADELVDPVSRRQFLRLMGAGLALAGVTGCVEAPAEAIVPYSQAPERIVPGRPLFYATTMPRPGGAVGVLVESHMGRPTKVEGNPDHPASRGATDVFAQASVLDLYDPARSSATRYRNRIVPWSTFIGTAQRLRRRHENSGGRGFRLLTEAVTSPTLVDQIHQLQATMPSLQWHRYDLARHDSRRAAAPRLFGRPLDWHYRLDRADIVFALDADLFTDPRDAIRHGHDFAERRRVRAGATTMCRLYSAGVSPSPTSATADHHLPLPASSLDSLLRGVATELGVPDVAPPILPGAGGDTPTALFVQAVAADLAAYRGRSLVVPGEHLPTAVHVLAMAINDHLGNLGATVVVTEAIENDPGAEMDSLARLTADMHAGRVDTLLILGGNPVYAAPADLRFGAALGRVRERIHWSPYVDETSTACDWHLPAAHFLESWSDARAFDGTASIVQPLIRPLFGGQTAHAVMAAFSDRPEATAHALVRAYWRQHAPGGPFPEPPPSTGTVGEAGAAREARPFLEAGPPDATEQAFEAFWTDALDRGVIGGTGAPVVDVRVATGAAAALPAPSAPEAAGLELDVRLDPCVLDGRHASNVWLQELPKPLTKLTWDNAVLVAPATAETLGLTNEQVVLVRWRDHEVSGPVLIVPGQAPGTVTLSIGYGRHLPGSAGDGVGFDANRLRHADAPWGGPGALVLPQDAAHPLAATQVHHVMHGRDFVRAGTLALFQAAPDYPHRRHPPPPPDASLYPEREYAGVQWGMVVDNTLCTGCNACVVACQAENNVPVVGKDGVRMQREMHWLRVDHYHEGTADNPRHYFQPMLCQHCEKAPCELVCPVAATVHSEDGLNQMVYNRCVGTRYCSNNCPYKVRRFNFLNFTGDPLEAGPVRAMQRNPDVTVRTRGVMEKCTYCIQRISAARIDARRDGRALADGDVVTACQAACPTGAIVFGNINDPDSHVARLKREPHNYALLEELQTQPRTTYLAAIRNRRPGLEAPEAPEGTRSASPRGEEP
ncbi:MAG: TAT-variant-translocated molybdopterin oxidoreductase [Vicinamibacterales bacterium]